jgi:hypothetical protein
MASKSSTAAKNVYTPLVMVSLGAWKTTLAGNTDFHCGSIDANFDPPQFRLDSTFKYLTPYLNYAHPPLVVSKSQSP